MTGQSHAQTKVSTSTTTGVFALLKAKPGVTRERVMASYRTRYEPRSNSISTGKSANGIREKTAREAFSS